MSDLNLDLTNYAPGDVSATIPLEPLVVLYGPNGAGKSVLRDVLMLALGDNTADPPRANDGTPARARLRIDGCELVVTQDQKTGRSGGKGFPLRRAAAAEQDLADLIGPLTTAGSRSDAAKAARFRALARMAGLTTTAERIAHMAGGQDLDTTGLLTLDLARAREEIAKRLRAGGKTLKTELDTTSGRIAELDHQLEPLREMLEPAQLNMAELELAVRSAERHVLELEASRKARREQEAARAAARTDIEPPYWDEVDRRIAALSAETAAQPMLSADWPRLGRLVAEIGVALSSTERAVHAYVQTQAILSRPITGATDADVEQAGGEVGVARQHLLAAQQWHRRLELEASRETLNLRRLELDTQHRDYLTAAGATSERLGEIMRELGLKTVSISETGELMLQIYGGVTPFADCSTGERISAAIEVWLETYRPEEGVIQIMMLPPECWYHLDTSARSAFSMALEAFRGQLVVITEQWTDGDGLTVEAYGG